MLFEEGLQTFALLVDKTPSDPNVQQCYAVADGNIDMAVEQYFSEFASKPSTSAASSKNQSKKRPIAEEDAGINSNKRSRMADADDVLPIQAPTVHNMLYSAAPVSDLSQVSRFAQEEQRLQAMHQRGAVRERHNMSAVSSSFSDSSLALAMNRAARSNIYHCILIVDNTSISETILDIFSKDAMKGYEKQLSFTLLYTHMPEATLVSSSYRVEQYPCLLVLETYRGLCVLRMENQQVRASRVTQHLVSVFYFLLGGGTDINGHWSKDSTMGKDYTQAHNIIPEMRVNEDTQSLTKANLAPKEYTMNIAERSENQYSSSSVSSSTTSSSRRMHDPQVQISPKYLLHAASPIFPSKYEILVLRFVKDSVTQREVGPKDTFTQVSTSVMLAMLHALFHTVTANSRGYRVPTVPGRAYDLVSLNMYQKPIPKQRHELVQEHTLRDALRMETKSMVAPMAVVDLEAGENDTIAIQAVLPRGEIVQFELVNHLDQQHLSSKLVEVLLQHQYTPKNYKVIADCGDGRQVRVKLANPHIPSGKKLFELKFSRKVIMRLSE